MSTSTDVNRYLASARQAIDEANRAIHGADLSAATALGVALRSIEPAASAVVLERDDDNWHLGAILNDYGAPILIDNDSEGWLDIEDWVDQALSMLSDGVKGQWSDDEKIVTLDLPRPGRTA